MFTQEKWTHLAHKVLIRDFHLFIYLFMYKTIVPDCASQNLCKNTLILAGPFPPKAAAAACAPPKSSSPHNSLAAPTLTSLTSKNPSTAGRNSAHYATTCRWGTHCRDESKCSGYDVLRWFIPTHHSGTDALSFALCSVLERKKKEKKRETTSKKKIKTQ